MRTGYGNQAFIRNYDQACLTPNANETESQWNNVHSHRPFLGQAFRSFQRLLLGSGYISEDRSVLFQFLKWQGLRG